MQNSKQGVHELIKKGNLLLFNQLHAEALHCYKQAWRQSPQNAELPFFIGNSYLAIKKHTHAIAYYKLVLQRQPNHVWALNNLGVAFNEKGIQKVAMECYDRAIHLRPAEADFYANRGKALLNASKFLEATADCQRALELNPKLPSAYYNLGLACLQLQKHADALEAFNAAVLLKEDYFEVLCARAQLHQTLKQHGLALQDWTQALKLKPDAVVALNARGILLKEGRKWQDALHDLNHALAVEINSIATLNNRGIVHHEMGNWQAALDDFEKILSITQSYPQALNNQANVWLDLGEHAKAIDCYQRALQIKPDYGWAQFNLGLCLLQLGDMAQGWRQYEWRWRRDEAAKNPRQFSEPLWLGDQSLDGKTLLIYAEQGLGDTLQFVMLVECVAQQGAQIILEVQAPLKPLLDKLPYVHQVIARGEPLPPFDLQCPLLSLPLAIHLTLDNFPKGHAYLSPDPVKVEKWRQRLGHSEALRVGLVWSGNPGLKNDLQRSIPASHLLNALPKGCQYVSLHKEYRADDQAVLRHHPEVLDFSEELVDFSETAALCSCLSLIISVDTSVAHLSAAMGIPVWLMLPFNPDFRWLLQRSDSPWYPSMRLFRQVQPRDWQAVFEEVRSALTDKMSEVDRAKSGFVEAMRAQQQGQTDGLEQKYAEVLEVLPFHADAWHLLGVLWAQKGHHSKAVDHIQMALSVHPKLTPAYFNLGLQLTRQGDIAGSVGAFQQAVLLNPQHLEALFQLAVSLQKLGRLEEAHRTYGQVLNLQPQRYQALCNRGVVLHEQGLYDQALNDYQLALTIEPDCIDALSNQSVTLNAMGEYKRAWDTCLKAKKLAPRNPVVLHNLGFSLQGLKKFSEAISAYREALEIRPDYAECWNNLGNAQFSLGQNQESIASHSEAIRHRADFADAYFNRANVWFVLKMFDKAIQDYEMSQQLNPSLIYLDGALMHARMHACDWRQFDSHRDQIMGAVRQEKRAITPFAFLGLCDDVDLLRQSSKIYARYKSPAHPTPWNVQKPRASAKIHLAYFSADFHNHATAYLTAELFERHDRKRFHVSAFSFGAPSNDLMRQRLVKAFDDFYDVREKSHMEVVGFARANQIDIAIDLKGYTRENRAEIFVSRVAPVQVNYLGYPGTMGMKSIDYLIADPVVIPPSSLRGYHEKIAYLPDCYQVNDRLRKISDQTLSRHDADLPEEGFVFCCFNNNYKILPTVFQCWMRILSKVPGSVLWLLNDNALVAHNLRSQAAANGVAPDRLVFADRVPLAQHLARHRLADLFLDTAPYNAHTTCSDALWADLPVLTYPGQSFASRVSASLLQAVGLSECIQPDLKHYEEMAVFWAKHPEKLIALRQKLVHKKHQTPLFDTPRFTENIESLYEQMHQRSLAGLAPDHLWSR